MPGDMEIIVDLSVLENIHEKNIIVDGEELRFTDGDEPMIVLKKGSHKLRY